MQRLPYTGKELRPDLKDCDIIYYPNFVATVAEKNYFNVLMRNIDWKQENIKIFGKLLPQPRLTRLFAESEVPYSYSGLTLFPKIFTSELIELRDQLKKFTLVHFTHCLANLYRDGSDSMGLHSDDEKVLGENPVIASISLGATRKFKLEHRINKAHKFEIDLEPGSLLLMKGTTQHYWKHQLPKTKKKTGPRINLTFRSIISQRAN